MNKNCLNCNKSLANKRGDAKFCDLDCKNQYNYNQKQGRLNGLGNLKLSEEQERPSEKTPLEDYLKNVIDPQTNQESKPNQKPFKQTPSVDADLFNELLNDDLPPLHNTVSSVGGISDFEGIGDEDEQELGEKESEVENFVVDENVLPEKYIDKTISVDNPVYKAAQNTNIENNKLKEKLEQELKRLEAELKAQESRNGNELPVVGGIGAGLFGFLGNPSPNPKLPALSIDKNERFIPKSKKKKRWTPKKQEEPSFFDRLLKGVVYAAIGTGAGYLAKATTEDWREQDKKAKIAATKKIIEAIKKDLMNVKSAISRNTMLIGLVTKQIKKTERIINPEYEKALNGIPKNNTKQNESMKEPLKSKPTTPVFKSDKIIRSTELGKQQFKALNFKGLWRDFFGQPSVNFHALIHGNSGEGKSTFCLWLARYLAENFGRVLYVSGEEGLSKTFHDKLISCKANVPDLFLLDVRTGDDFMNEIRPNEFHFIIIDSLHDMEIDARKLKTIFERYKNTAFICIDQNNKKGELLGANEKKHIVDIVVNVKNYIAETTKNRFKTKGVVAKTRDFTDSTGAKIIDLNAKRKNNDDGYNLDSDRKGLV